MPKIINDLDELLRQINTEKQNIPVYYLDHYVGSKIYFFLYESIVLPFIIKKNYFLNLCQCIFYPLSNNKRIDSASEKKFLNLFVKTIKTQFIADRIVQSLNHVVFKSFPDNSVHCKFGSYQIDLTLPLDQLWLNIHPKHKNVIRNAEKNKVDVLYGVEALLDFYNLYYDTMKRSAMYCEPKEYFQRLIEDNPNNIICAVAYSGKTPVGGVVIPFTQYGAFYVYGASAEDTIVNGAINYLHWEIIKKLKSLNVSVYDLVGARMSDVSETRLYGIQRFKERFGSTLSEGYLWKIDLNSTKCFMYDTLLRTKLKLKSHTFPLDIIDQENAKIKT